jgi:SET domain-containing protein
MEEGHVKFYALRDIAIDEELTFCYIDEDIPPKERKELIFSSWNFHCTCQRCGETKWYGAYWFASKMVEHPLRWQCF